MVKSFKRIYDLRVDNDLTQKQMASILNITEDQYFNFEQGRSNFPLDVLEMFTDYFNVSFDYICSLSNKKIHYDKKINKDILKERLKEIRKLKGLSQEKCASIVFDRQPTYCNYESGYSTIPLFKLYLLCKFYNVSIDYMLGKTNDKAFK